MNISKLSAIATATTQALEVAVPLLQSVVAIMDDNPKKEGLADIVSDFSEFNEVLSASLILYHSKEEIQDKDLFILTGILVSHCIKSIDAAAKECKGIPTIDMTLKSILNQAAANRAKSVSMALSKHLK